MGYLDDKRSKAQAYMESLRTGVKPEGAEGTEEQSTLPRALARVAAAQAEQIIEAGAHVKPSSTRSSMREMLHQEAVTTRLIDLEEKQRAQARSKAQEQPLDAALLHAEREALPRTPAEMQQRVGSTSPVRSISQQHTFPVHTDPLLKNSVGQHPVGEMYATAEPGLANIPHTYEVQQDNLEQRCTETAAVLKRIDSTLASASPRTSPQRAAPFQNPVGPQVREFDTIDANHDGEISRAEFVHSFAPSQASSSLRQFDRIDANHDGVISRSEFAASQPLAPVHNPAVVEVAAVSSTLGNEASREDRLANLEAMLSKPRPVVENAESTGRSSTLNRLAMLENRLEGMGVRCTEKESLTENLRKGGTTQIAQQVISAVTDHCPELRTGSPDRGNRRAARIAEMSERVRAERISMDYDHKGQHSLSPQKISPIKDQSLGLDAIGKTPSSLLRGSPTRYSGAVTQSSLIRSGPVPAYPPQSRSPLTAGPSQQTSAESPVICSSPDRAERLAEMEMRVREEQDGISLKVEDISTHEQLINAAAAALCSPNKCCSPDTSIKLKSSPGPATPSSCASSVTNLTSAYDSPESEEALRKAVLFEETSNLLCMCSTQLCKSVSKMHSSGAYVTVSQLKKMLENEMSLGPDHNIDYKSWISLFGVPSSPCTSLQQISTLYSAYETRLQDAFMPEPSRSKIPTLAEAKTQEASLEAEVNKALSTWLSPARAAEELPKADMLSKSNLELGPPTLAVPSPAASQADNAENESKCSIPMQKASAVDCKEDSKPINTTESNTALKSNRDFSLLARSVCITHKLNTQKLSSVLLHQWSLNTKAMIAAKRDKVWKSQADQLFVDVAETTRQLVMAQEECQILKQKNNAQKHAKYTVMKNAVRSVYRENAQRTTERTQRNALTNMWHNWNSYKMQHLFAVTRMEMIASRVSQHHEARTLCVQWGFSCWVFSLDNAKNAGQGERLGKQVSALQESLEHARNETERIKNLNQHRSEALDEAEADKERAEARSRAIDQEAHQLQDHINKLECELESQTQAVEKKDAESKAKLQEAQQQLQKMQLQVQQLQQQLVSKNEELACVKGTLSPEIEKLTAEKLRLVAELEVATKEAKTYKSRWNNAVGGLSDRRVLLKRNHFIRSLGHVVRRRHMMKRSANNRTLVNLFRLFARWVAVGKCRQNAQAQLEYEAEGSLFQQRSAALIGMQRSRTNLMRAMGRWQLHTTLSQPPARADMLTRSLARACSKSRSARTPCEVTHSPEKENLSPENSIERSRSPQRRSRESPPRRSPTRCVSPMKEINSYEDALLWSPTKKERLKQESVWTAGASIVCRILAAETQTSVMRMFTEWMAFTSLSQIQKMRKMGKKTMVKVGGMAGVSMTLFGKRGMLQMYMSKWVEKVAEQKALRRLHQITEDQMSQLKQKKEAEVMEKEEENADLKEKLKAAEEVGKMQRKAKEALKKRVASLEQGIRASRKPLETNNAV